MTHKKENTKETTCVKCKQKKIVIRSGQGVHRGIYQCPACGAGFKMVWI